MNILFVCHRFPFPPNRGGKIRPFNMIRHLSGRHSITVATLAHSEEELKQGSGLHDYCSEVLAEVVPSSARWMKACHSMVTKRPASVSYFWSSKLARRIKDSATLRRFDVVLVHCAFAAQYVTELPCSFRVLDFGDLDSGKWEDYAGHRRFPLSLAYKLEAGKLRQFEQAVAAQFDECTVTTSGEWEDYQRLGIDKPCTVIPNGVDTAYFQPGACHPSESPVMVFLGRMDYFPNVDGIVRFVRDVFPRVRSRMPNAQLKIVGSNPARAVRKLAETPGVHVTGYVPDVRPYLTEAAVAIAPLLLARGTQNKILECMAAGVPVVSSVEAARGIKATPGRDLLVAATTHDFASRILELLQDQPLRRSIADRGRQQVEQAHSWPEAMKILDAVLENCVEKQRAGVSQP